MMKLGGWINSVWDKGEESVQEPNLSSRLGCGNSDRNAEDELVWEQAKRAVDVFGDTQ